ncbi:hypothetical protein MRX96_011251 [Rhipicephalus microplus]
MSSRRKQAVRTRFSSFPQVTRVTRSSHAQSSSLCAFSMRITMRTLLRHRVEQLSATPSSTSWQKRR